MGHQPDGQSPTLLPTTVVGSYPVPDWLERLKTDYYRGQISAAQLNSVHEVVIKAALKDQELAGIDIVSDGELRRDNDIDYLLARIPGITTASATKEFYYDYLRARVRGPIVADGPAVGLAEDYTFTRRHTDRPIKFSFTGPFSLARRVENDYYPSQAELVRALARLLNVEARALVEAGATTLQIDEPFLAGCPDEVGTAIEAVNIVTDGVRAHWGLHVCYGNRYARPSFEGHYDFLFPAVHKANIDQLTLEFARKGYDDLELITRSGWDRELGLGVIDVKSRRVEDADLIGHRLRRALDHVSAERLFVNPDCGLRHLPVDVARAKLHAMVRATRTVRADLTGEPPVDAPDPTEEMA